MNENVLAVGDDLRKNVSDLENFSDLLTVSLPLFVQLGVVVNSQRQEQEGQTLSRKGRVSDLIKLLHTLQVNLALVSKPVEDLKQPLHVSQTDEAALEGTTSEELLTLADNVDENLGEVRLQTLGGVLHHLQDVLSLVSLNGKL